MKQSIKASFVIIFTMLFLFCFTACNNDKIENYTLTSVLIRNIEADSEEILLFDNAIELYPNIVKDIGKTIKIINEKEIIFSGNETEKFNGKIEYYDSGFITYITVENKDFYINYENISIMKNLYIECRVLNAEGHNFKYTFQFEKEN